MEFPSLRLRGLVAALTSLTLLAFPAVAAAQEPATQGEAAPPASTPAPPPAPASTEVRTERNSLPLMVTGIAMATVGVAAIGAGTVMTVVGTRDCNSQANDQAFQASNPALYGPARQQCRDESDMLPRGLGAILGGAAFTVIGTGLLVVGAWKVPVAKSATAPELKVGLGSVSLGWKF